MGSDLLLANRCRKRRCEIPALTQLAVLDPVLPVLWPTRMMRDRENDNAVGIGSIDN